MREIATNHWTLSATLCALLLAGCDSAGRDDDRTDLSTSDVPVSDAGGDTDLSDDPMLDADASGDLGDADASGDDVLRDDGGDLERDSFDGDTTDIGPDSADASDVGAEDLSDADASDGADGGDEPDVPAVCEPTSANIHYWVGTVRNGNSNAFSPDTPSEEVVTPLDFFGDTVLAAFEDQCVIWWLRIARTSVQRLFYDEAGEALYVALLGGSGSPLEFRDRSDAVVASWPEGEDPLYRSAYLARYDLDGTLRWATRLGPTTTATVASTAINSLFIDETGALRFVGYQGKGSLSGELYDFTFGPGESEETILASPERHGFSFTATLDPETGEFDADSLELIRPAEAATSRELRFTGQDGAHVDAEGARYLSGGIFSAGTWVFDAGEIVETTITTATGAGFVVKYDDSGTVDWVRTITNPAAGGHAFGQVTLSTGGVIVGGSMGGDTAFEESTGAETVSASDGLVAYITRYDADGDLTWVIVAERDGSDGTNPLFEVDEAAGALYVHMAANEGVTFDAGGDTTPTSITLSANYEGILARFDLATGAFVWARRIASAERANLTSFELVANGIQATVWAREETTINVGESDELVVGRARSNLSGLARWDFDGNLVEWRPLVRGTGVLASFGYIVRVLPE